MAGSWDQQPVRFTPIPVPEGTERVVLFGGTFDPPHVAHTELGSRARDAAAGGGSWLVLVPASRSPFKAEAPSSDTDRVEMLRRAIRPIERAGIWTDELDRASGGAPSYWVDTLRRARSAIPGAALWFIIGADQAAGFHRWREPREILALAEPILLLREPLDSAPALEASLRGSGAWSDAEIDGWLRAIACVGVLPASATDVRETVRSNGAHAPELAGLIAPEVLEYIRARRLYTRTAPS